MKYGFAEVEFSGFGPLQVDVLDTPRFKGFAGFYEEALREGSALVFYPNCWQSQPLWQWLLLGISKQSLRPLTLRPLTNPTFSMSNDAKTQKQETALR